MSWLFYYCVATYFASLIFLSYVSAEEYDVYISSSISCPSPLAATITSGVATSTVTVNTTFVTFTVYEETIGATHEPYLGRRYSEYHPTYNSTAPFPSPQQTSTPTLAPNDTGIDECPTFDFGSTIVVPSSTSIIPTSQLITTTITLPRVSNGPIFPGGPAATSNQNAAQGQGQPGASQPFAVLNQPSVQQTSSPGNGGLGQPQSPQPGRVQAFGQAGAVQPSPTRPNSNAAGVPQPVPTLIGEVGDETQPGSEDSPTTVASPEEVGVSVSGAVATDDSVSPEAVSDNIELASSQGVQSTSTANYNTKNALV